MDQCLYDRVRLGLDADVFQKPEDRRQNSYDSQFSQHHYFTPGRGAKYYQYVVRLSPCLLVRWRKSKTTWPNFTKFCACCLWLSYSDGVVIRYVLPVLWITSCFRIMAIEHDKHDNRDSNQIFLNI